MSPANSLRPLAPAVFCGVQRCYGIIPDFELWTLTADIAAGCKGSSINRDKLVRAGYYVPAVAPEAERAVRRAAWYFRTHDFAGANLA